MDQEFRSCAICSGILEQLGMLGNRLHLRCRDCGMDQLIKVARAPRRRKNVASREEQHARYLDCGPSAWDDR